MNDFPIKIVIDTNVLFMAVYDRKGKARKVIDAAVDGKITLYAPDSVKKEIFQVLQRELQFTQDEIESNLNEIPIRWIKHEIYESFLDKTKIKHKSDKPIEAVALMLGCGILSADMHFKERININELLERV